MTIFSLKSNIKQTIGIVLLLTIIVLFAYFRFFHHFFTEKKQRAKDIRESSEIIKTELAFREKTYTLDYKNFDPSLIKNISTFNPSEAWKGSGFYDTKEFFEYPGSLVLAGNDRDEIVAKKEVSFDLGKIADFDLILNLRTEPDDLESANLIFMDENSNNSAFALPKLSKGWQILKIPKEQFTVTDQFNWARISQVRFEFLPRPLGKVVVNLGGLRGQAETSLYNDWNIVNKQKLLLDKRKNKINLMLRDVEQVPMIATIKEITTAINFKFSASFSPLTETWSGLFFRGNYKTGYGYYLMVNGVKGSQWQIYKVNKDGLVLFKRGTVKDLQFKLEEWYSLKVEMQNDSIKGYLSTDGNEYLFLGGVIDSEFSSGGVGVAVAGIGYDKSAVSLFNDFDFRQFQL